MREVHDSGPILRPAIRAVLGGLFENPSRLRADLRREMRYRSGSPEAIDNVAVEFIPDRMLGLMVGIDRGLSRVGSNLKKRGTEVRDFFSRLEPEP